MRLFPLLILGGAATFYLLRMRQLGTNIKIAFRNIKIKGGTILQPNIELTIGVQNPTRQSANLNSIVGQLEYEGKIIADISNFTQVQIQGNTETIVKINAIPQILNVLSILRNVIINRQPGKTLNISGKANINNIIVPFNSSFTF